jgi:hypothetical protein
VRPLRLLATLALVVALAVIGARATSSTSPSPSAVPCTAAAIGRAFDGALSLRTLDNYGCSGAFAFAWATVGSGAAEVSLTEVLRFDASAARWRLASRARYCHRSTLGGYVYRRGCLSN